MYDPNKPSKRDERYLKQESENNEVAENCDKPIVADPSIRPAATPLIANIADGSEYDESTYPGEPDDGAEWDHSFDMFFFGIIF